MTWLKQIMALFVAWSLIPAGVRDAFAYQDTPPQASPPQALAQSTEQLQQLVAPIALYPDSLVAQILAASTYPSEIVEAEQWMEKHKDLQGEKLAKEVNKEHWDPSVKALTQFPAVLANMNQNLAWTSQLGDAYINQAQQLNAAIQTMRQKAQAAGNLKTTQQETVSTQGSTIVIQPASPDVVYVPQYDPWSVYGYPIGVWPGWYPWPGLYIGGPGIAFGLGFGVGLFAGFGWGWGHWGYNWHGGGHVTFDNHNFVSRSTTIVNRGDSNRGGRPAGDFHGGGFHGEASHGEGSHGGDFAQHNEFHGGEGMHSGAFSGFDHGGVARDNSFRGASSFHGGGGGFHGGGAHGGGGRR